MIIVMITKGFVLFAFFKEEIRMEKKKGIISAIFAIMSVCLLTLSVYATNGKNSVNVKANSPQIYRVVVPAGTNGAFNFTIDPYGMTTIGASGQTLDKLLENPPGLVTSDAITIENKSASDVAVTIEATLSLPSGVNISLAKSENEARTGIADLYLKMSPVLSSRTNNTIPDIVFTQIGQTEKKEFTLEGAGAGKNSAYNFVVDGYANPNSKVWAGMTSQTIGLDIVYSFKDNSKDETSSEDSSGVTTPSSSQTVTKDPSSETQTKDPSGQTTTPPTPPDVKDDVEYKDDIQGFTMYINKTNLSATPTKICIIYKNKPYNLSQFGLVVIESEGNNYKIAVSDYSIEPGTYDLLVYSGNTVIYDKAQLHVK